MLNVLLNETQEGIFCQVCAGDCLKSHIINPSLRKQNLRYCRFIQWSKNVSKGVVENMERKIQIGGGLIGCGEFKGIHTFRICDSGDLRNTKAKRIRRC